MDKNVKDNNDNSTMIMIGVGILAFAYFYNQGGDSEGGAPPGGGGGGGGGETFGSFGGNSFNDDNFNVDSKDYSKILAFEKFNRKFGADSAFLFELASCEGDRHYTWADGHQTRCACPNDYEVVTDENGALLPMFDDDGDLWDDVEKNGYYVCRHNLPTDWNRGYDEEIDELFYYKTSEPTYLLSVEPELAICSGDVYSRPKCHCANPELNMRITPEKHPITGQQVGFLCTNEKECMTRYTCRAFEYCWNTYGYTCDGLFNPEEWTWYESPV